MDQKKPKSISLNTAFSFARGTRYLVMAADLSREVRPCKAEVTSFSPVGAWLSLLEEGASFPEDEELFLIEFQAQDVLTHRVRVASRDATRIKVGLPSLTERERSQLAPFTGRADYRVTVDLPVQVRICDGRAQSLQQWPCKLHDLSRGGMSLSGPVNQPFERGQKVDVRVVSWEYPVRIETEITRVWTEGEVQRVAMAFPAEMTLNQRELISTFILQVQRRDSLGRSLPSVEADPS